MLPPVTRIHRTASAHGLGGKALENHGQLGAGSHAAGQQPAAVPSSQPMPTAWRMLSTAQTPVMLASEYRLREPSASGTPRYWSKRVRKAASSWRVTD